MSMINFEKKIAYKFKQKNLLEQAFTHKSFAFENLKGEGHNERLEFLGDAILDLVLAQELMKHFPEDNEGALSKKRASLVNEAVLTERAIELGLNEYLRLGKGELQSGGAQRPRILSSTYEAVVGAYFLERGYEKVQEWVWGHFIHKANELSQGPDFEKDFKTRLQVLAQTNFKTTPTYELISESGPAHARVFISEVIINEKKWLGEGVSKKNSEQAAAEKAMYELTIQDKESSNV